MIEFESAEGITELPLPTDEDTSEETVKTLLKTEDTVEEVKAGAIELHDELDELVFDLYRFADEKPNRDRYKPPAYTRSLRPLPFYR